MPPKDKIVIEISSDSDTDVTTGSFKNVDNKLSLMELPAAKPSSNLRMGDFKYSNTDTLSKKPNYRTLTWSQGRATKFRLDSEPNTENHRAQLASTSGGVVSTSGFLVSKDGIKLAENLLKEQQKREQVDDHDWSGSGIFEIMLNMMKDFDRDIFQKTVSPYNKWAYIEGLASFLTFGSLIDWAMCDDSSRIEAIVNEFGTMLLTSLEMLSEHNLLAANSTVKNIPVILLLLFKFLKEWGELGYEIGWPCEIVRQCDEAGIDLVQAIQHTSEKIKIQEGNLHAWRLQYQRKQNGCTFAQSQPFNGNGYMYWANKQDWQPKQDGLHLIKEFYQPDDLANYGQEDEERRKWFRWDWKMEYSEFQTRYHGGSRYVLNRKVRI
ncbi:uncharacterized protein EAE97_005125 [Botrytis byssoidea]|uniref:Uncharacterized protein n=1 Tax=Botrytis byssoidea TaxID=139641 RepID=A0A9P5M7E7_9HELO|nr:uncharacterized protein EAE97_005125 [Botrytis byssoidea]KAF7946087.1 hypothetical protein EAE97_005125 [Botrytis byssoidea]